MMAVPSSAQLRRAAKTQRSTALVAVGLVLAWVSYQAVWPNVAPASYWFQVDRVEVLDAEALAPPPMIVERQIRRAFRATWVVTVMREGAKGFYTFCTARGENDYWPGNALPDVLNLDWWTWPHQCQLPAGRYVVNTVWTLNPVGYPAKEVRIRSNIFTVR